MSAFTNGKLYVETPNNVVHLEPTEFPAKVPLGCEKNEGPPDIVGTKPLLCHTFECTCCNAKQKLYYKVFIQNYTKAVEPERPASVCKAVATDSEKSICCCSKLETSKVMVDNKYMMDSEKGDGSCFGNWTSEHPNRKVFTIHSTKVCCKVCTQVDKTNSATSSLTSSAPTTEDLPVCKCGLMDRTFQSAPNFTEGKTSKDPIASQWQVRPHCKPRTEKQTPSWEMKTVEVRVTNERKDSTPSLQAVSCDPPVAIIINNEQVPTTTNQPISTTMSHTSTTSDKEEKPAATKKKTNAKKPQEKQRGFFSCFSKKKPKSNPVTTKGTGSYYPKKESSSSSSKCCKKKKKESPPKTKSKEKVQEPQTKAPQTQASPEQECYCCHYCTLNNQSEKTAEVTVKESEHDQQVINPCGNIIFIVVEEPNCRMGCCYLVYRQCTTHGTTVPANQYTTQHSRNLPLPIYPLENRTDTETCQLCQVPPTNKNERWPEIFYIPKENATTTEMQPRQKEYIRDPCAGETGGTAAGKQKENISVIYCCKGSS